MSGSADRGSSDRTLCAEPGRRLAGAGVTPTGRLTCYYEKSPRGDDQVIVHAAVPVAAEPGDLNGLTVADLPAAGSAATIVHRGLNGHGGAHLTGSRPLDNRESPVMVVSNHQRFGCGPDLPAGRRPGLPLRAGTLRPCTNRGVTGHGLAAKGAVSGLCQVETGS
jgi:hypothetical protein